MLLLMARYGTSMPLCKTQLVKRESPSRAGRNRAGVARVEKLKQVERFTSADLAKQDAIRTVT
jgi:hypothetical protein